MTPLRIALVAGEKSGDILAAGLIKSLKQHYPHATFEGIAGEAMQAEGCVSLHPLEALSVMGFSEVIKRLPQLLAIRRNLKTRWLANPPDLFIGIDAPDFNLQLEKTLHNQGIKTVHYVSPSVWAWREKRVEKIKGNLDLMLTLFPFEQAFYEQHNIPACCVGHPLADTIPLQYEQQTYRQQLNIPADVTVLAVLPGSRRGELKYLSEPFIQACQQLMQKQPELYCLVPSANPSLKQSFQQSLDRLGVKGIHLIDGQSREAMAAADVVLMASGTAALEGMLLGKPMVVAGKVSWLTSRIIRWFNLLRVDYVTLPNNLLNQGIVPELLQEDVTVDNIVTEVEKQFALSDDEKATMQQQFHAMHKTLRQNASQTAANLIHQRLLQP